jgi:hypothetical protein
MLDGVPKQLNTFPRLTTKPVMIVQSEPLMEVTPDLSNAEWTIVVTESGRARVVRQTQSATKQSGRAVNCDGVSNLTDFNSLHRAKSELPRVETEEGTVNDLRFLHAENA